MIIMLRHILLLLPLCLFAACGGGGGGGGGGGPAPDTSPGIRGPVPIVGYENIVACYAAGGVAFQDVSNTLDKTAESILVSSGSNTIMFLTGDGEGTTSNFYADGAFIKAEKDGTFDDKYPDGSYTTVDGSYSIYLGGKNLGLEYADFGIWLGVEHSQDYYADDNPLEDTARDWVRGEAFWIDANKNAHRQAPAAGSFEGTTIAWVSNDFAEGQPHALLRGAATLDVSGQGAGLQGTLGLKFDDYYNFSFGSILISGDGSMRDVRYKLSVQVTENPGLDKDQYAGLCFDLGKSYAGNIDSQFYGAEGAGASEAAGSFYIFNPNDTSPSIKGAFGVKEVIK